ncbi:MAG: hypothetical protein ACTSWN_01330 [Promethearchaeota archaeon]
MTSFSLQDLDRIDVVNLISRNYFISNLVKQKYLDFLFKRKIKFKAFVFSEELIKNKTLFRFFSGEKIK